VHQLTRTDTATATEKRARPPRRGGRPSRADASRLGDRILEVATDLFLTDGYGATTIEAVAKRAGISKRTFYHRFTDKAELFGAVVHRVIAQIRPPSNVPLLQGVSLEDVLRRLARLILQAALSPPALALHRLVTAESGRFPELTQAVARAGGEEEAMALIGGLLSRELSATALAPADANFAALQFLYMVVSVPQRRASGFGAAMSSQECDAWCDSAVDLFLHGCVGWRKPKR
jgi:TetR/AcrR family transcriptional repressor of mexJK operon